MTMRILVTGAAGYLGTTLVPRLLNRNWHVTALDLFTSGAVHLARCCADRRFDAIRMDVRRHADIAKLVRQHDAVINLAALVGAPICDRRPDDAVAINVDAARNISDAIGPSQLLLQPTSDSGYGVGYETNLCTEESPLNPVSLYGRTKVEAETHVIRAGGISLRLASVFGMSPRMRLDLMVNEFTWRAATDRAVVLFEAHFRRNFVHIRDVVAAFLHAIDHYGSMRGQVFNCGLSAANMSKQQLCDVIVRHVPGFEYFVSETGRDPDRRDYIVSNQKLEATGWAPQHSLDDGIEELLKGYRMMNRGECFNA